MPEQGSAGGRPGTLLVVAGADSVPASVRRAFRETGFGVTEPCPPAAALDWVSASVPGGLVLLDLDRRSDEALRFLEENRHGPDVPVVAIGSPEREQGLLALRAGADDFVSKPVDPLELVARARAVLRRAERTPLRRVVHEGLEVALDAREATVDGRRVQLPRREFDLLAFLASHPRRAFTKDELLRHVWGSRPDWQTTRTVTEHVRRLRVRIERDPADPERIVTVRGVGYRFEP